ncbi:MAG TPA: addiction module protein [Flavipsychrobacter sp.]|nr:addiction module protein [Flavipsychrobacter sp.]
MSINPQFTYDNLGNPVGVFLPIDEWNQLAEELHLDIPEWQKELIEVRLAEYNNAPSQLVDWNKISESLDKEDEEV